jgi:transcription initiation factor TFIID TATA-box-binding protein
MTQNNIKVVNVVATGELEEKIRFERLYDTGEKESLLVRYEPEHHQGCYLRFDEEGPLITIYSSGKYIVRATSVEEVYHQREKLIDHLEQLGISNQSKETSLEVNNIVGSANLGREIDLDALSKGLTQGEATYNVSTSRIVYKMKNSDCTIIIFRTGQVTIMGAPSVSKLEDAWGRLTDEINSLFAE